MHINLAFAAVKTSSLYDTLGIDFLHNPEADLPEQDRTGQAEFIQWVGATDQNRFELDAADGMLAERGLQRTTAWENVGDYYQAEVEAMSGLWVCDYDTTQIIREATPEDICESIVAREFDGGAGAFESDGRTVYVD